jgi:hypothetical protein
VIPALPGAAEVVYLDEAPTGLVGRLEFEVLPVGSDAPVVGPTMAGIAELLPGYYAVDVDTPITAGDYRLRWIADRGTASEVTVKDDEVLRVTSTLPAAPLPAWAPTVDDIAEVVPAYARGGFDDEGQWAGAVQTDPDTGVPTFTDNTSPTAAHVTGLIKAACEEVIGRVGTPIPALQYGLARVTARWHVASMVAAGKTPQGTDDASGEYRANISNFRNSLDELVAQSRMGPTRLA